MLLPPWPLPYAHWWPLWSGISSLQKEGSPLSTLPLFILSCTFVVCPEFSREVRTVAYTLKTRRQRLIASHNLLNTTNDKDFSVQSRSLPIILPPKKTLLVWWRADYVMIAYLHQNYSGTLH